MTEDLCETDLNFNQSPLFDCIQFFSSCRAICDRRGFSKSLQFLPYKKNLKNDFLTPHLTVSFLPIFWFLHRRVPIPEFWIQKIIDENLGYNFMIRLSYLKTHSEDIAESVYWQKMPKRIRYHIIFNFRYLTPFICIFASAIKDL